MDWNRPSKKDRCQRGRDPVIRVDGSIEIPLTMGQIALVDAEDYVTIRDRFWSAQWHPCTHGYRAQTRALPSEPSAITKMHRLIMGLGEPSHVDHKNHDTL